MNRRQFPLHAAAVRGIIVAGIPGLAKPTPLKASHDVEYGKNADVIRSLGLTTAPR